MFPSHVLFARLALLLLFALSLGPAGTVLGQESALPRENEQPETLENGDMETVDDQGHVSGWTYPTELADLTVSSDSDAQQGERSLRIDWAADSARTGFSGVSQAISAEPYRGKTLRYRVWVKTANLTSAAQAQLWMRIDGRDPKTDERYTTAFDNMGGRPIRSPEWAQYEVVLPIAEDAEGIALGLFLTGPGSVWMDDASLEVTTQSTTGQQSSAAMQQAMRRAAAAPQQPFFTWWLLLPLAAMAAFVLSMTTLRQPTTAQTSNRDSTNAPIALELTPLDNDTLPLWRSFLFRFTVAYWGFYTLPTFFVNLIPWISPAANQGYQTLQSTLVHWTARTIFGIEEELVPPLGSGDTTYNYIALLIYFVLALAVAIVFTLLRGRLKRFSMSQDLMRSYLRYVLAFAMLNYGLAKFNLVSNQFPVASERMLDRSFGSASPMGLVWTFMGASRAYTLFAGAGELLGALLLIWRRTALLGALVTIGVMTNVVMLNFCYDIPVKLYSSHLLMMGLMVLLPDAGRLLALFFWHTPVPAQSVHPSWGNRPVYWAMVALKTLILVMGFAIPLFSHTQKNYEYLSQSKAAPTEPASEAPRLMQRGFRWINEVPFNR